MDRGVRAARAALIATIAIGVAACGDEDAQTAQAAAANRAPIIDGTPSKVAYEGELYEFTPTASDPDGDPILFGVDGKPGWADFDTKNGRLSGRPDDGDRGKHKGIVIWVSDGETEALLPAAEIEVMPAPADNQAPQISGNPAPGVTAGSFYDFVPVASDADGDALTFKIQNQPGWAEFDPQIGRLFGSPGVAAAGSYGNIIISVTDGIATAALDPFVVVVNPPPSQNTPPTIDGTAAPNVLAGNPYSFTPTAFDADGDTLTFSAINLPPWAQLSAASGTLSGTPVQSDAGTYGGISIVVTDGEAEAALPSFSIEVAVPNSAPTIGGNPPGSVQVGEPYGFVPAAGDADGDVLTFSIAGKPSWAGFNPGTGALTGTPSANHVGTYSGISIMATDGEDNATLGPFSIDVVAAPNSPPTIGGNPPASVQAGSAYGFVPTAGDADGDTLSFSISGQPSWASLDPATGALTGTPGAGDVGTYNNISITVTDGADDSTLGPFSIQVVPIGTGSATLTWTPPTENTDGSPLTDLAGYVVYWGTAPGSYASSVTLSNPGLTSYVVDNLLPGTTYYFAMTAYNSGGMESSPSNEASKTIP